MYYKIINKETKEGIDFFDEKTPTLFKEEWNAKTCMKNHILEQEYENGSTKIIEDPYIFFEIISEKHTLKSRIYFFKRFLESFKTNIKYNKLYFLDSLFGTKLQKYFLKY